VLLSDTVGFIRNLPHTLVTAFRATLEEVQRASLVLHVADATSPTAREHAQEVEKVLGELDALGKPRLLVVNKIDLLPEDERAELDDDINKDAKTVHVSAVEGTGVPELLERIDAMLDSDPISHARLRVPQSEGKTLSMLAHPQADLQGWDGEPRGRSAGIAAAEAGSVPPIDVNLIRKNQNGPTAKER
jgi:GTP-binding protein HflX